MKVPNAVVAVLVAIIVLVGSVPTLAAQVAGDQNVRTLADSSNDLGFRLLEQIRKGDEGENVFISPASIMLALAMTYNGANNITKEEMARTLALEGIDIDSLNAAAQKLMNWLEEADTSVQLAVANSIWKKSDFPFKESFVELVRDYYESEVFDLGDAEEINEWVTEKTKEKIRKIVDVVQADDIMFLINAIYFKGSWTQQFATSATRERDFHLVSSDVIKHQLMEHRAKYPYWEDETAQAIKLPYGDKRFSMVVLLPSESDGIDTFLSSFSTEYWQEKSRRFLDREGTIVLPRFEIEYEVCLNDTLESLGMPSAFAPDMADFGNMWYESGDTNVYIGEVLHKTYVKVNEEGTEAAAVTSVRMKFSETSASIPPPPFEMIVDRPFVCVIVEEQTGIILFIGAIYDPR